MTSMLGTRVTILDDGCWQWNAARRDDGYGVVSMTDDRTRVAHRVVYELFVGKLPPGYDVDHLCSNASCVNPNHLEAVAPCENRRRQAIRLGQMPDDGRIRKFDPVHAEAQTSRDWMLVAADSNPGLSASLARTYARAGEFIYERRNYRRHGDGRRTYDIYVKYIGEEVAK